MDLIKSVREGLTELAVTYPVLASLCMSTFLTLPPVKEVLITVKLLHEVFIENDEDEYDEDDYDEDVYKLFNENDEDENNEDENDEDDSFHYYYYDVNDDIYD